MFKILFLILIIMSSAVFAQQTENNEQKEKPKSYIFLELGIANDAEIKAKMEEYSKELLKSDSAEGYLINYGKAEKVSKRERQIINGLDRHCHYCRIVIVNGGESEELKTVFWVVPYGAEPPTP
jgi:hypothetical protein